MNNYIECSNNYFLIKHNYKITTDPSIRDYNIHKNNKYNSNIMRFRLKDLEILIEKGINKINLTEIRNFQMTAKIYYSYQYDSYDYNHNKCKLKHKNKQKT